ncbi:MAG: hypothetical protein KF833_02105 [Verrucomicrobiae bacterium]|nr:hypothetical protein [Verrucomicrobiae bacterium]
MQEIMQSPLKWLHELLSDPGRPFWRVLLFGAAGGALGLISAALSNTVQVAWFPVEPSWISLLGAHCALGAGAALVAVFVLTGIDAKDVLRCCGVALLAGYLWDPVFRLGSSYIRLKEEQNETLAADISRSEMQMRLVIRQLEASPTDPALIGEGGDLAARLTRQAAEVRSRAVRAAAELSVNRYVHLLKSTPGTNNIAAIRALDRLDREASAVGHVSISAVAREAIEMIPVTTNSSAAQVRDRLRDHRTGGAEVRITAR